MGRRNRHHQDMNSPDVTPDGTLMAWEQPATT